MLKCGSAKKRHRKEKWRFFFFKLIKISAEDIDKNGPGYFFYSIKIAIF